MNFSLKIGNGFRDDSVYMYETINYEKQNIARFL